MSKVTIKIEPSQAVNDVLVERVRQLSEEGWTAEHDDEHTNGALAQAAACYAVNASEFWHKSLGGRPYWPFDLEWWKPKGKRRDLVRAAALILAELERIDRASARTSATEQS